MKPCWMPSSTRRDVLLPRVPANREQRSNTFVAQIDSEPGEHRRCERDERRIQFPDSNVCGDRATQIAREKHSPKNGRARYHVQQHRAELERGDEREIRRFPADSSPFPHVKGSRRQFPSGAHQYDEDRRDRNDAAGPHQPPTRPCCLMRLNGDRTNGMPPVDRPRSRLFRLCIGDRMSRSAHPAGSTP